MSILVNAEVALEFELKLIAGITSVEDDVVVLVEVVVLFGGVSASLAAECSSDPNECTPKKLCEVASFKSG